MGVGYIEKDTDMDDNHPLIQIVGEYFFHEHLKSEPTDYSMFINATGELDNVCKQLYGNNYKDEFLRNQHDDCWKCYFIYHGNVEADNIPNILTYFESVSLKSLANIAGIVIVGDMKVSGTLQHFKNHVGLYILGDVYAKNIILSNDLVVKGNVYIEHILYGFYNDGYLQIKGRLEANTIISDDYQMEATELSTSIIRLRQHPISIIKKHIEQSFLTAEDESVILQHDKYIEFILSS